MRLTIDNRVGGLGLRVERLGLRDQDLTPRAPASCITVVSDSHHQSTLDAVYVCVVLWSGLPIVPSYPHYPHASCLLARVQGLGVRVSARVYGSGLKSLIFGTREFGSQRFAVRLGGIESFKSNLSHAIPETHF